MSELENSGKSKLGYLIVIISVIVGVAAVGAVGYISGAGWFGYRQIMYGNGQVYLLNMGSEPLSVTVEDRETVIVPPEDARAVDVVGGESELVVRTVPPAQQSKGKKKSADGKTDNVADAEPTGEVVERHSVFVDNSHALLKLTKEGCLVASDVGAFYGRGGEGLEFVEMIEEDQQVYVPGTTNVIWPRQTFPGKFDREGGDAIWLELVGCSLLEQEEFLRAYLDVRLGNRLNKARGGKPAE